MDTTTKGRCALSPAIRRAAADCGIETTSHMTVAEVRRRHYGGSRGQRKYVDQFDARLEALIGPKD